MPHAAAAGADACSYVMHKLWRNAPSREIGLYPVESESRVSGIKWVASNKVTVGESKTVEWRLESEFDFDNDGNADRVLRRSFEWTYMYGDALLVLRGVSPNTYVSGSSEINEQWLLPCQLDATAPVTEGCPPLSQLGDGTELAITTKNHNRSIFPARYSQMMPFVLQGEAFLAIQTTSLRDGERGIGVVRPMPNRSFETLCVVRGNSILSAEE